MSLKTLRIQNGDVVIKRSSGRLETISEVPKARQALHRLLALDLPWGAGLGALIGRVTDNEFSFSARIQRQIRAAFEALVEAQGQRQVRDRSLAEQLDRITQLLVQPANFGGGNSKTGFAFKVVATNRARQPVETSGGIAQ